MSIPELRIYAATPWQRLAWAFFALCAVAGIFLVTVAACMALGAIGGVGPKPSSVEGFLVFMGLLIWGLGRCIFYIVAAR